MEWDAHIPVETKQTKRWQLQKRIMQKTQKHMLRCIDKNTTSWTCLAMFLGATVVAGCGDSSSDNKNCQPLSRPRVDWSDAGDCDDSAPAKTSSLMRDMTGYQILCDPLEVAEQGCKGLPNDLWGSCSLPRCDTDTAYPVNCVVGLPTHNPRYPGIQSCRCTAQSDGTASWICGT